jgi:hypothetical protein
MALRTFGEVPNARVHVEFPPAVQTRYRAVGLDDALAVEVQSLGLLAAQIVSPYGILFRQPIQVERIGYNVHEVLVEWAQRKWSPLDFTIRGRTTGGTQKIIGSLATVEMSENAPNFNKLIGVNADGTVEGTEVVVPVLQLAIDVQYPIGFLNSAMIKIWSNNTGKVNNSAFLDWAAGEVLYEGSEFEDGTNVAARVTHNVSISPNISNVTIAGLTIEQKKGWEFLWFRTVETTDTAGGVVYPVKQATHYYVEQIYQTVNVRAILGF